MTKETNIEAGGNVEKANIIAGTENTVKTRTDTGGGHAVGGDVNAEGGFTGRDAYRDRQGIRGGDQYFGQTSQSDNMQIWMKILEMAADMRVFAEKLDDLPGRVGRLEKTEVVVRPGPEVVIRPIQQSDSVNLSLRVVYIILIGSLVLVGLLVAVLIFQGLANG